jgi:4-hydroxy 2-oxovalerate aldolase
MLNKKNLNILDCTLRDGGYYNNWNFSKKLLNEYINSISKTDIKNIEIGFLTLPFDGQKGITANCDHNFFKKIDVPGNINLGIMINATDFLNKNEIEEKQIIKTIKKLPKSKVKFIRVACHFKHLFKVTKFFKILKKRGFKIFLNIMQISDISDLDISRTCKVYKNLADVIYFADSFGSINEKQFKKIIIKFKKNTTLELGIHAHDNMKKALKNTIMASKNGVRWLDSTILGMGRGPGNTKTEELVKSIYGNSSKTTREIKKLLPEFNLLKKKYNWGTNKYYWLSGKYKIHPTYIQMLLSDNRYKNFNYTEVIQNLKKYKASKYNPNTLYLAMDFYQNKSTLKNFSKKEPKINKDIIIFGNGKSLQNKNVISKKLISQSTKILINRSKYVEDDNMDIIVYCHPLRLITDIKLLKKSASNLLLPYNSLPNIIKSQIDKKNIINFDLKLGKNIRFNRNSLIIPKPLGLIYALGYLISRGVKKVYLAGFDGFEADNPFKDETQVYINHLKKSFKNFKIISLTKTKLNF